MARKKAGKPKKEQEKPEAQKTKLVGDDGKEKKPNESAPIPKEGVGQVVKKKMQYLLGTEELKPCRLPKTIPENPFVIGEKHDSLMVINCPFFGSLTEGEHGQDIVKNSLRIAEATKCNTIVISELLFLITQRWGKLRPYMTRVSGIKIDPEKIEAEYPESIRKDERYESVAKRLEKGEPVFMAPAQKLSQIFELIHKTFVDEKGKPVYGGQVFVTLGRLEDEAISFFTNEWVRIRFFRSRAYAEKQITSLTAQLRKSESGARKKLQHELYEWKMWRDMWLLMNNISDHSTNQARDMVTGFFVKKIEEAIPNAKVVSIGDTYFKAGSKLIMITADKDRANIQGNLAKSLKEKTESFGKGRNPDKIPDLMLGMGPNPFLEMRLSTHQASSDPVDKEISLIAQLPMCIDAFRYRSIIRDSNVLKDLITRVGRKSGFESGVVMFTWYPGLVQPVVDSYGSRVLNNPEIFRSVEGLETMVRGAKLEHLLFYLLATGDEHCGAGEVILHRCPDDAERPLKYNWQVALEFLMNACAPLIALFNYGDTTHQQNWNYATKYEGANRKTPTDLLKEFNAIQSNNDLSAAEKVLRLKEVAFKRDVRAGIHSPDKQVHEYASSLRPYVGYLVEILRLKKKCGIKFDGTLATILYIMGNHCKNTYKTSPVVVSDALHIIDLLKKEMVAYLIKHPVDGVTVEDVEKELGAPQNGYVGEGRGSISIGNKKSYALMLKHKQGDANAAQRRSQRRSVESEEVGLPNVTFCGDRHAVYVRLARDNIIVQGGCSLGKGVFGSEIDGSDQDVCSLVCGLPVGGLRCGPIRTIFLDEETMRKYAAKPFKPDIKKVFLNALK